jgi:hypothetical protein
MAARATVLVDWDGTVIAVTNNVLVDEDATTVYDVHEALQDAYVRAMGGLWEPYEKHHSRPE